MQTTPSIMRILGTRAILLSFLCSLMLPTQGCHRSLSPDEVFRSSIFDPVPASVSHLQGYYVPRHEWFACLRFIDSSEDFARIVAALDAHEDKYPSFDRAASSFADAPASLRPPKDWSGRCSVYGGLSPHGVAATIIAKPETGEVFISLDQT